MLSVVLLLVPLSVLVFVIGLVKPKWILFWMKEPDRLWASSIGLLMFMASVTLYSEVRLKPHMPAQGERKQGETAEQRNQLELNRR